MPRHPIRARGASAVTVAIALTALGGFAALVLNVGRYMMVRGQLQNAADAAALAAAMELDGKHQGLVNARAAAADFAARHATDRDVAVTLDPASDVIFGHWDREAPRESAFTPVSETVPNAPRLINAVRVKAGREATRGNPLEVFFPVFSGGKTEASAATAAVATGGAPCDDCSVPLVFADCAIMQADGTLNCGTELVFQSDTVDNVGFTNLTHGDDSVNTAGIIASLGENCRSVGVGDVIGVGNGNNLNNHVVNAFEGLIERVGATVKVPITSPPGGCPAKFNGFQEVVGFATFTIVQVDGPPHPAITIRLDCDQTSGSAKGAGCAYFGTTSPRPVLVR